LALLLKKANFTLFSCFPVSSQTFTTAKSLLTSAGVANFVLIRTYINIQSSKKRCLASINEQFYVFRVDKKLAWKLRNFTKKHWLFFWLIGLKFDITKLGHMLGAIRKSFLEMNHSIQFIENSAKYPLKLKKKIYLNKSNKLFKIFHLRKVLGR
jgi:hypothetical protein